MSTVIVLGAILWISEILSSTDTRSRPDTITSFTIISTSNSSRFKHFISIASPYKHFHTFIRIIYMFT